MAKKKPIDLVPDGSGQWHEASGCFQNTQELVALDGIHIPKRKRKLDQGRVKALAESIRDVGLINPIHVYVVGDGEKVVLIAGRHRLEAMKSLGWGDANVIVVEAGELDRELIEIDENLMRAELTELERSEHLARRREIFDAKGGAKIRTPGGEQQIGFDRDTADKTGLDKSTVRKSRQRAEKIIPEVKEAIANLPAADKGVELDAIASMTPDEQKQALERVTSGASKTFREARDFILGPAGCPISEDDIRVRTREAKTCPTCGGEGRLVGEWREINTDDAENYRKEQDKAVSEVLEIIGTLKPPLRNRLLALIAGPHGVGQGLYYRLHDRLAQVNVEDGSTRFSIKDLGALFYEAAKGENKVVSIKDKRAKS